MNESKTKGSIMIDVITNRLESNQIPKLFELFNESLRIIKSKWFESKQFIIEDVEPGTYTIRLSMSSGIQEDETFELAEGENKTIGFDIGNNSPHESHEWAFLNKSHNRNAIRSVDRKAVDYNQEIGTIVSGTLWRLRGSSWYSELLPNFVMETIRNDGFAFSMNTARELSVLEVSSDGMQNLYITLPPGNNINVLVKTNITTRNDAIHQLDVTVSTTNYKAETLLTLLTIGDLRAANQLSNAQEAEDLLYQKMVNPVTAAIGGYFLLKINELSRLHDWAHKLAKWFDWLPDGSIIYATQLLSEEVKTENEIDEIRSRLLHSVSSGFPVYSEGLRLLERGLNQLWFHSKQSDDEVKNALNKVNQYLEAYDFTQETTTFIGSAPDQPLRPKPLNLDNVPILIPHELTSF